MKRPHSIGGNELFFSVVALIVLVSFMGAGPNGVGSANRAVEVLKKAPSATDRFLERVVQSGTAEVLQATIAPRVGTKVDAALALSTATPRPDLQRVAPMDAQTRPPE